MSKLLIVEPDEAVADSFSQVLGEVEEWQVAVVPTAEDALTLCLDDAFDVVITTNHLSGQCGEELIWTLKNISPGTLRFLLIGEDEVNLFRSLVSDAQQILLKPVQPDELIAKLRRALALRAVIQDPAILKVLGDAESLPPLPRVFREVSEKLRDPSASLHEVADIISEDIVLSSKVLKIANSALFNLNEPAGTISHAVNLIGSAAICSLVFSQSLGELFKSGPEIELFAEELNRHSLECAMLVSHMLTEWDAKKDIIDKAFFCAIAHDLGKLILATYVPEKWKLVQEEVAKQQHVDMEVERIIAGVSHCELAAYLLAVWGFPYDQVEAIAYHHDPSKASGGGSEILCALHLADSMCKTKLHGSFTDWDYLEKHNISEADVEALAGME